MINCAQFWKVTALSVIMPVLFCLFSLPAPAQNGRDQIVVMQTTRGTIRMRIFYSVLPYTATNFLDLVESGFYNGLTFHRVENWVIQGGDPNGNGSGSAIDQNTGQPRFLRLEASPHLNHNQPGMVAMARFANNLNSASCQFYITKCPMPQLNGKYAVFGRVLDGMDAVYAMRPGDRIISASIMSQNNSQPSGNAEPVPAAETGSQAKPDAARDSGF